MMRWAAVYMPSKNTKVAHRNRSPYGWWVAAYLLRFEREGENRRNLSRRCLAWENTIIVRARDRNQAYAKAVEIGRQNAGGEMHEETGQRKGTWVFEGVTELLPVYDELEDGAEILWTEHRDRTVRTVKSWVRSKSQLAAFHDVVRPNYRNGRGPLGSGVPSA